MSSKRVQEYKRRRREQGERMQDRMDNLREFIDIPQLRRLQRGERRACAKDLCKHRDSKERDNVPERCAAYCDKLLETVVRHARYSARPVRDILALLELPPSAWSPDMYSLFRRDTVRSALIANFRSRTNFAVDCPTFVSEEEVDEDDLWEGDVLRQMFRDAQWTNANASWISMAFAHPEGGDGENIPVYRVPYLQYDSSECTPHQLNYGSTISPEAELMRRLCGAVYLALRCDPAFMKELIWGAGPVAVVFAIFKKYRMRTLPVVLYHNDENIDADNVADDEPPYTQDQIFKWIEGLIRDSPPSWTDRQRAALTFYLVFYPHFTRTRERPEIDLRDKVINERRWRDLLYWRNTPYKDGVKDTLTILLARFKLTFGAYNDEDLLQYRVEE